MTSIPTVKNGQLQWFVVLLFGVGSGSGSKEMSKGLMKAWDARIFSCSVCSCVVSDIYPASDKAGWSVCAQLSHKK